MSYQVRDVCYSSAVAAANAQASGQVGSIVVLGVRPYVVSLNGVTGTTINYTLTQIDGTGVISSSMPFTPVPCNMLTAADGLALGWMVGTAWIAAYSVLFITRVFRGETTDNYGNS